MRAKRFTILLLSLILIIGAVAPVMAQSKIATIIYTQELDNLNPMYTNMWFAGITVDFYLSPAWNFDGDLNPNPVLVTEIPSGDNGGINEDGTVITLTLRDDIVWSDGAPITSADFLFTYEMIMSPDNLPNSRYPYDAVVTGVEAPDERTVVVSFDAPFAPWITTIFTFVLPEHVLRPVFEAERTLDNAAWNRGPTVGSGPFTWVEWESGSHLLFTRNENYFNSLALLDGIFIRFVPDDAAQVAALINGDGDLGTFISYSDLAQLEAAGVEYELVASGYNEAWFFNINPETAHPAMLDVNVRRALQLAFDRWKITETLLLGGTYPAASYWEGTIYANPDVSAPPYDPEEAARLLDEAGWVLNEATGVREKDGVALELRYLTPPRAVRMDTQEVVRQDFAELGIRIVTENPSFDVFWNSLPNGGPIAAGQFDLAQWSQTSSFPDPNTSVFLCAEIPTEDSPEGGNWTGYCNPEVDALFQLQAQTVDFDERVAIIHQISALMAEDAVWTGVWYDPDVWAVSGRMVGVELNGATPYWNANMWDIE